MPDSSFFNPMQMGGPGMFPGSEPPRPQQTPTFKAGYKNIYGTQTNVGLNPITKQATVDARFPVGDFRNQLFLTGGGYASPATPGQKADWGVRVGFEKKIAPQGAPVGQLIDQALNQALPAGVQNAGGFSPESRAGMMAAMTDEDRLRLFQNVKAAQNQIIDQQLGVVPGATKYGINFGVDMKTGPSMGGMGPTMPMGTQSGAYFPNQYTDSSVPNPDADPGKQFARSYASGIQQQ